MEHEGCQMCSYFMEQTNARFDKIDDHLEKLISFRLMFIGYAAAVSSIMSLAIAIYFRKSA